MKAILVGVGEFGSYWYRKLRDNYKQLEVIVVDKDEEAVQKIIDAGTVYYASLEEAVVKENPDFVINVTPPSVHNDINNISFDFNLPVLCEKPIADSYEAALSIVERAEREHRILIYGENYRFDPYMRKLKALLDEDVIGEVSTISVDFFRNFFTPKPYFNQLENPILEDVAIHHIDLIRFLSGSEITGLYSKCYNPAWSWTKGNMNLDMLLETKNNISINYRGSMVTAGKETPWLGNWRIEGSRGALEIVDYKISLIKGGVVTSVGDLPKNIDILDEFLQVLEEGRDSGVSGRNYIRTQELVYLAAQSSKLNKFININQ